jgi:hypothetical protein
MRKELTPGLQFGIFDLDKNGLIDQSEFLLACQAIDIPISKGDATELMQHWGIEKPRTTVTNLQLRPKYFLNEDSFFSIVRIPILFLHFSLVAAVEQRKLTAMHRLVQG